MKVNCNKCLPNEEIEVPNFTLKEKIKLFTLIQSNPLQGMLYLKENFKMTLAKAKFTIQHINKSYNKCHRCSFDLLDSEYSTCPKCKALNFNWKIEDE